MTHENISQRHRICWGPVGQDEEETDEEDAEDEEEEGDGSTEDEVPKEIATLLLVAAGFRHECVTSLLARESKFVKRNFINARYHSIISDEATAAYYLVVV